MNYLAHAFLSGNNEALLVGNFLADHLRGNRFEGLPADIRAGVKLHREIDAFTDAHPLFRQSKRLFYNGFEKYSGILVDIYFDHFLAKNFSEHSVQNLSEFSASVYKVYEDHRPFLPPGSSRFLDYLVSNNIYSAYAHIEGIWTVLNHLSRRIGHNVQLDNSRFFFFENEELLERVFSDFFAEAKARFLPR